MLPDLPQVGKTKLKTDCSITEGWWTMLCKDNSNTKLFWGCVCCKKWMWQITASISWGREDKWPNYYCHHRQWSTTMMDKQTTYVLTSDKGGENVFSTKSESFFSPCLMIYLPKEQQEAVIMLIISTSKLAILIKVVWDLEVQYFHYSRYLYQKAKARILK